MFNSVLFIFYCLCVDVGGALFAYHLTSSRLQFNEVIQAKSLKSLKSPEFIDCTGGKK